MSKADQRRSQTLLVGGERRPGVAYVPGPGEQQEKYDEVILQTPLGALPDPWLALRNLWSGVSEVGILSVITHTNGKEALAIPHAHNLLQLAGFREAARDAHGNQIRIRASVRPRVARPLSCTVVIPCRNELGNVAEVVRRIPDLGTHTELIFVDGDSSDGTPEKIRQLISTHPDRDIKLLHQTGGGGKAAAVFQGFDRACGDVLLILDADMTVAPEELPRFYLALAEGVFEFANGTRFAFPMEENAMQPANNAGNRVFGRVISWLVDVHITDTLCGTKALFRKDWPAIRAARPLFGGHDPWGDFDLLLGAGHAGLRIGEVPVRYYARTAGESKMRRVHDGVALARTCLHAMRELKLPRARNL